LHLLDIVGVAHVYDSFALFRVGLNASLGQHETQELASIDVEGTLFWVEA